MAKGQISLSNILSFMHGNPVDLYGDANAAKQVMPTLKSCMAEAVKQTHIEVASREPHASDDKGYKQLGIYLHESYRAFLSQVLVKLPSISSSFRDDWTTHYAAWLCEFATPLLTNPNHLGPTDDIKLPSSLYEDAAEAELDELSRTLFKWYVTSLDESAPVPSMVGSFEKVSTRPAFSTIPQGEWRNAWTSEFRGHVLESLELKLDLNVQAVWNDGDREIMSRIIPVVQASGTGKSRLAEEYTLCLYVF